MVQMRLFDDNPKVHPKGDVKRAETIYIPSRGRCKNSLTADLLAKNSIEFFLVVEPSEKDEYSEKFGERRVLMLPECNMGIAYARNWIKDFSEGKGEKFHWQIDDNIKSFMERIDGKNAKCNPEKSLAIVEAETKSYKNVALSGLKHHIFAFAAKSEVSINSQIYSCFLVKNFTGFRWRSDVVEDTDYSMQVLASGLCTMLFNRLLIEKETTMRLPGGNTEIEYSGDGRLRRSLGLQKAWPGVFKIKKGKDGLTRIAPSRIWISFGQRPILKD